MYKLIFNTEQQKIVSVLRIADGAQIQFNEQSTDYQAYLAWIAEGNQPTPPDEEQT